MTKKVIPDSNVFMKLLYEEKDSYEAQVFFKTCAISKTQLIVPELFKYEITEVTRYFKTPLSETIDFFQKLEDSILTVVSPTKETWLLAEKIAQTGHIQSGYPSMYDSIYHAIAVDEKAVFLTCDKRHYRKSNSFGHIQLLENWENIFIVK